MADEDVKPTRQARKCADIGRILVKEEIRARFKQVEKILKKEDHERSREDVQLLQLSQDVVQEIEKRAKKRQVAKQRQLEVEDSEEALDEKCDLLARAVKQAKNLIVYTGAGISTAASIPDYRGPNGVWTLLQQGKNIEAQDLSDAVPTLTHMGISKLHEEGLIKYVVSQNCDGLHLRSGLPRHVLSEVHGNMYIEICPKCKPVQEYVRLFDVTEKTALHRHKTERLCHKCGSELLDTIVHFGEKSRRLDSVYQWKRATDWASEADMILCLGSSLKVLKKYSYLWAMNKAISRRPKLYIVNLQWTPKDDVAALKINGRCDVVIEKIMEKLNLNIPGYQSERDAIYHIHTPLRKGEESTTSKKILEVPKTLASNSGIYTKGRHERSKKMDDGKLSHRKRKAIDHPSHKSSKKNMKQRTKIVSNKISQPLSSLDHTYAWGNSKSLSHVIDEVVAKYAADVEPPDQLEAETEKPRVSNHDDKKALVKVTDPSPDVKPIKDESIRESFQTTRWLLSQPPLYNPVLLGLSAVMPTTSQQVSGLVQHAVLSNEQSKFPVTHPDCSKGQMPNSGIGNPPNSHSLSFPRTAHVQSPNVKVISEDSTMVKKDVKPETEEKEAKPEKVVPKSEPGMSSKYPILSGFIKKADELHLKTSPTSSFEQISESQSDFVFKQENSGCSSSLVGASACQASPSKVSASFNPSDSNASKSVREKLLHHIKRRRSSLQSGCFTDSPLPSPEPYSPRTLACNPSPAKFSFSSVDTNCISVSDSVNHVSSFPQQTSPESKQVAARPITSLMPQCQRENSDGLLTDSTAAARFMVTSLASTASFTPSLSSTKDQSSENKVSTPGHVSTNSDKQTKDMDSQSNTQSAASLDKLQNLNLKVFSSVISPKKHEDVEKNASNIFISADPGLSLLSDPKGKNPPLMTPLSTSRMGPLSIALSSGLCSQAGGVLPMTSQVKSSTLFSAEGKDYKAGTTPTCGVLSPSGVQSQPGHLPSNSAILGQLGMEQRTSSHGGEVSVTKPPMQSGSTKPMVYQMVTESLLPSFQGQSNTDTRNSGLQAQPMVKQATSQSLMIPRMIPSSIISPQGKINYHYPASGLPCLPGSPIIISPGIPSSTASSYPLSQVRAEHVPMQTSSASVTAAPVLPQPVVYQLPNNRPGLDITTSASLVSVPSSATIPSSTLIFSGNTNIGMTSNSSQTTAFPCSDERQVVNLKLLAEKAACHSSTTMSSSVSVHSLPFASISSQENESQSISMEKVDGKKPVAGTLDLISSVSLSSQSENGGQIKQGDYAGERSEQFVSSSSASLASESDPARCSKSQIDSTKVNEQTTEETSVSVEVGGKSQTEVNSDVDQSKLDELFSSSKKLKRTPSVPGWFGKGLKKYKKRR